MIMITAQVVVVGLVVVVVVVATTMTFTMEAISLQILTNLTTKIFLLLQS